MNIPLQLETLPELLGQMGFGEVHLKYDPQTELLAIITIHNDKFGPAIGGCRCIEYSDFSVALQDALKLAQGMSYKTAISNLTWGGGKAVLLKPKQIKDRQAYYRAFGRFVNELGGRYITSIDSGTELSDLEYIAQETDYVSGLAHHYGADTDPSLATAIGVKHGIETAVKFKFATENLVGLRLAIQGVGHVGYHLCELLQPLGVELIVSDVDPEAIKRCQARFKVKVVTADEIHKVDCEVFSPCALGGVLTEVTIPELKAAIVAGSANNQLASLQHGALLTQTDILYAPDFVISAGGVILATALYDGRPMSLVHEQLQNISNTLLTIFTRAKQQNLPTHNVAAMMAEERLSRAI